MTQKAQRGAKSVVRSVPSRERSRECSAAPRSSGDPRCEERNDGNISCRPRWNFSVKDDERAIGADVQLHSFPHYEGVDIVEASFPERIKHTAHLRYPDVCAKPRVWSVNMTKARQSNSHFFHLTSPNGEKPPLSYLARKIVEDAGAERLSRRQGWCASTSIRDTRHVAAPPETNHLLLNTERRRRRGLAYHCEGSLSGSGSQYPTGVSNYVSPRERVRRMNESALNERRLRQEAGARNELALYTRPDAPPVFKMSNLPLWSALDPVQVATEQVALRSLFKSNPYSSLLTRNM